MFEKITNATEFLSDHSESLLHKVSNNKAERLNSLICHGNNGKRSNYSLRSQYSTRVAAQVLQYNTQAALSELFKVMDKKVPFILEDVEKKRQLKLLQTQERRRLNGRRKKRSFSTKNSSKFYGLHHNDADISNQEMKKRRENLIDRLKENKKNRLKIQEETVKQNESHSWKALRKIMLTSLHFETACTWSTRVSCGNQVKKILYPAVNDECKAVIYGLQQEKIAKEKIIQERNIEITSCGLFIDEKHACLGSSPDGIIDDDWILEIKCPYSAANVSAEEAMTTVPAVRKIFHSKYIGMMNKRHAYYYQVQGQLHITRRSHCLFVIHTPLSRKYIIIDVDHEFWKEKMEKQLRRFYMDCMLPEILDSRHNRKMPIRNPQYTLDVIKEKKSKNSSAKNYIKNTTVNTTIQQFESKMKNLNISTNQNKNVAKSKIRCNPVVRSTLKTFLKATSSNKMKVNVAKKLVNKSIMLKNGLTSSGNTLNTISKRGEKRKMNDLEIFTNRKKRSVSVDDDVIIISYSNDPTLISDRSILEFQKFMDSRELPLIALRQNVLPVHNWLSDDSIDSFIRILKTNNSWYVTHNCLYVEANIRTYDCTHCPSIQIMGGGYISHWRCLFFDGQKIKVYDSLPRHTNYELVAIEKSYIRRRFNVTEKDVTFEPMLVQQPDSSSCGVYAAAFAETLASRKNPSKVKYSRNVKLMREHFVTIVETKKLSSFPTE